jgi:Sec-independent protein translocase protein TatA
VVGPQRLPAAARTLAIGLSRARQLAASLTEPVHTSLQQPRRVLDDAWADLRASTNPLAQPIMSGQQQRAGQQQPEPTADPDPARTESASAPYSLPDIPPDPSHN